MMILRGRYSRTDDRGIYIVVSEFGIQQEFGPCQSLLDVEPQLGDFLIVGQIGDVDEDLAVLGRVGGQGLSAGGDGGAGSDISLHANPDFEDVTGTPAYPTNWERFWGTNGSTVVSDTSEGNVKSGTRSAKYTLPVNSTMPYESNVFDVVAGSTIEIVLWAKSSNSSVTLGVELLVRATGNPDYFDGQTSGATALTATTFTPGSDWTLYTVKYKIPLNQTRARISVRGNNPNNAPATAYLWVDSTFARLTDLYEPAITPGTASQYWRGDKSWQTLDKAAVGLSNVLNVAQEPALPSGGTTSQYLRGDKTWQALNKATVGLGNVDNTSDLNKPISSATQTALDTKYSPANPPPGGVPSGGTTSQYLRGDSTWQTLDKSAVGLGNVDNTSDASKPISTATQTALNGKEPSITAGTTSQYWRGDKTWQTLNPAAVGAAAAAHTHNASDLNAGIISPARLGNGLMTANSNTVVLKGGSNDLTAMGSGTAGQVLTSAGAGQPPVWSAAGSGLPSGGTTSQYLRGDSTWQTLNAAAAGALAATTTLDNIPAPQAAVGMNFFRLQNLADPLLNADATTKQYVDARSALAYPSRWTPILQNGIVQSASGRFGKTTGSNTAWDASVYSLEGYTEGCRLSFRTYSYIIATVGLDASPTSSNGYTDIDYAWRMVGDGTARIQELGSDVGYQTYFNDSDVFEVVYDKNRVSYLLNGIERRSVYRAPSGTLYFDSSFYNLAATALRDVTFEPLQKTRIPLIASGNTLPTSAAHGQIAWDGVLKNLRVYDYDAGSWLNNNAFFTSSTTTFPAVAGQGMSTYRSDLSALYTYDNAQWVPTGQPYADLCLTTNFSPMQGLVSVDGVTTTDGMRVLCVGQTDQTQNGVWVARSGAWVRAADLNRAATVTGAVVAIRSGNVYSGTRWRNNFRSDWVVGVQPMLWSQDAASTMVATSIVSNFSQAASAQIAASTWTVAAAAVAASQGTDITYNQSDSTFTINRSGWYRISAKMATNSVNVVRAIHRVFIGNNPDANILMMCESGNADGGYAVPSGSETVYIAAGSVLRWWCYMSSATSVSERRITIEAVGQMPATDPTGTVATRVYMSQTSGQNASTNLSMSVAQDTHGCWTGTTFVCKVPGVYAVAAQIKWSSNQQNALVLVLNGTVVQYAPNSAGPGPYYGSQIFKLVPMKAGDVLALQMNTNVATFQNDATGASNYMDIIRIDAAPNNSADTGWISMVPYLQAGWAAYPNYRVPQFKRVGLTVKTRGLLQRTGASTTGPSNVAIIPGGFTPTAIAGGGTDLLVTRTGAGTVVDLRLSSQGLLQLQNAVNNSDFMTLHGLDWDVD